MATTKMTHDSDAIVTEIHVAAPPERVFHALTDPGQVVRWWGQAGIYRCSEFQSDLRVGGEWRCSGFDGREQRFEIHGFYRAVEPPRLLIQSWIASWTGSAETEVRWELEASDQGTIVRIRHSGFADHPELAGSFRGWPRMLGWLRALLERGESVEDRKPTTRV